MILVNLSSSDFWWYSYYCIDGRVFGSIGYTIPWDGLLSLYFRELISIILSTESSYDQGHTPLFFSLLRSTGLFLSFASKTSLLPSI